MLNMVIGFIAKEVISIATHKVLFFNQNLLMFFFFLHGNICCGYLLEVSYQGTSNEYPQHMFSWRKKKIFIGYLI